MNPGIKMRKIKWILVSVFAVIWGAFFITDCICTLNKQKPVFAVPLIQRKDGGSAAYFGLGYRVNIYVWPLEESINERSELPDIAYVEIGPYWMSMDFSKKER